MAPNRHLNTTDGFLLVNKNVLKRKHYWGSVKEKKYQNETLNTKSLNKTRDNLKIYFSKSGDQFIK